MIEPVSLRNRGDELSSELYLNFGIVLVFVLFYTTGSVFVSVLL